MELRVTARGDKADLADALVVVATQLEAGFTSGFDMGAERSFNWELVK